MRLFSKTKEVNEIMRMLTNENPGKKNSIYLRKEW